MSEQFQAGNVVQLKSGGPAMTICISNEGQKSVTCAWWNPEKAMYDQQNFLVVTLEPAGD